MSRREAGPTGRPAPDGLAARLASRLGDARPLAREGFLSSLGWAAAAGVVGALATMLFRACIAGLVWLETGHATDLVDAARSLPPAARIAIPTAGGLFAGLVLWIERRRSGRDAGGDYMEAIAIGDGVVPVGKSLWRSVSSLFTIATGGSIGREGPMVQLAAPVASLIGAGSRFSIRRACACWSRAARRPASRRRTTRRSRARFSSPRSCSARSRWTAWAARGLGGGRQHHDARVRRLHAALRNAGVSAASAGLEVLLFVALGLLSRRVRAPHFLRLLIGIEAPLRRARPCRCR